MNDLVTLDDVQLEQTAATYADLRAQGIARVQALCSDIWTDYNEHDPGVTTLEQFCYALTELTYRAEFPIGDLLVNEQTDRIELNQQALYVARQIFPCNPVTRKDYRKLLIDRVDQVANAWLFCHEEWRPGKHVGGLYDIWVYVPADATNQDHCDPVTDEVLDVYSRHRGLCEDVRQIRQVRHQRCEVCADVSIGGVPPDQLMARILFELGVYLAPEPKRHPLSEALRTMDQPSLVFNGPLMLQGFIDDSELPDKATEIAVQDLVSVITDIDGVFSVHNMQVDIPATGEHYRVGEVICVDRCEILVLDSDFLCGGNRCRIRLLEDGRECRVDMRRVERKLQRLWAAQRKKYPLDDEYSEYFPAPTGQRRRLKEYTSIQEQYPDTYGINSDGLPESAGEARRGQAKQFKGYLLIYDQLMADYFAQLANTKKLYSLDASLHRSYFFQYLNHIVPNVDPLLKKPGQSPDHRAVFDSYRRGLPAIIRWQDDFDTRRNRFLNLLLALYAESLAGADGEDRYCDCRFGQSNSIEVKLALLSQMVMITRDRGRGFDYREPAYCDNLAGMVIKCRILLGMSPDVSSSLEEMLDEQGVNLVDSPRNVTLGNSMRRFADQIEESFERVSDVLEQQDGESPQSPVGDALSGLRSHRVNHEFLQSLSGLDQFWLGSLSGESQVSLVCQSAQGNDWHFVGKFEGSATACACAQALVEQARQIRNHCEQLYIVEHNLLRFGRSHRRLEDEHEPPDRDLDYRSEHDFSVRPVQANSRHCPPDRFQYSYTISAVVGGPLDLIDDRDYRVNARHVIRQNTPAHIDVEYVFLGPLQLLRFEYLYWDWRRALRSGRWRRIVHSSARLRHFLQRHTR